MYPTMHLICFFLKSNNAPDLWYFAIRDKPYVNELWSFHFGRLCWLPAAINKQEAINNLCVLISCMCQDQALKSNKYEVFFVISAEFTPVKNYGTLIECQSVASISYHLRPLRHECTNLGNRHCNKIPDFRILVKRNYYKSDWKYLTTDSQRIKKNKTKQKQKQKQTKKENKTKQNKKKTSLSELTLFIE